jgi:hypothetical protein
LDTAQEERAGKHRAKLLAATQQLFEKLKLAGVDDLFTARAAIRLPASCGMVAHRKLATVA